MPVLYCIPLGVVLLVVASFHVKILLKVCCLVRYHQLLHNYQRCPYFFLPGFWYFLCEFFLLCYYLACGKHSVAYSVVKVLSSLLTRFEFLDFLMLDFLFF